MMIVRASPLLPAELAPQTRRARSPRGDRAQRLNQCSAFAGLSTLVLTQGGRSQPFHLSRRWLLRARQDLARETRDVGTSLLFRHRSLSRVIECRRSKAFAPTQHKLRRGESPIVTLARENTRIRSHSRRRRAICHCASDENTARKPSEIPVEQASLFPWKYLRSGFAEFVADVGATKTEPLS